MAAPAETLGDCGCQRWPQSGETAIRCADHRQPDAPFIVGQQVRTTVAGRYMSLGTSGLVEAVHHYPGADDPEWEWLVDVRFRAFAPQPLLVREVEAA